MALRYRGELVVGIVKEVVRNESYYAWLGGGSFLDGNPIRVSKTNAMDQGVFATGFPYDETGRSDAYLNMFWELVRKSRATRRFGSAALDLVYVASGKFDGYYEYHLNAWDIAAGALIVKEAGGRIAGFYGDHGWENGESLIAATPGVFPELQEMVRMFFP